MGLVDYTTKFPLASRDPNTDLGCRQLGLQLQNAGEAENFSPMNRPNQEPHRLLQLDRQIQQPNPFSYANTWFDGLWHVQV